MFDVFCLFIWFCDLAYSDVIIAHFIVLISSVLCNTDQKSINTKGYGDGVTSIRTQSMLGI